MMRRREFIAGLGSAAAWPVAARAQIAKTLRLGIISINPRTSPPWMAFLQRLRELGHIEGQNFTTDFVPGGDPDTYYEGAKELVRRGADLLIATGNEIALKAALAATNSLPIVVVAIDYDPLARGYLANLARPSSNVTGVFFQQIELSMKRLELVKEAFPELQVTTVLWDQTTADQWRAIQDAAAALRISVAGVELIEQPYDYERVLSQTVLDHRRPLYVVMSGFFFRDRERLANLALRRRAPSIFGTREFVDAGGLLSYGPGIISLFKRAAEYADRIARGAKPADLPIEQPTKFEVIVNLKTAKALGLTIPETLLATADEVIQ
jgi:putative tryptophan/tyrosine transport system substrate-binding protein